MVFISPHAKKAVKEKPRNVGGAFLMPCARLTVRGFSKLAQVMGSSVCVSRDFFQPYHRCDKSHRDGTHTENELRWL